MLQTELQHELAAKSPLKGRTLPIWDILAYSFELA
jgi:hypothetical protein